MGWFRSKTIRYPSLLDIWQFNNPTSESMGAVGASVTNYCSKVLDSLYETVGSVADIESIPPEQEWNLTVETIAYSMECAQLEAFRLGGESFRDQVISSIEGFVSAKAIDRFFSVRAPESLEQCLPTLWSAMQDAYQRLSAAYQNYEKALAELGFENAESVEGAFGRTYLLRVDEFLKVSIGITLSNDIFTRMQFEAGLTSAFLDTQLSKYIDAAATESP